MDKRLMFNIIEYFDFDKDKGSSDDFWICEKCFDKLPGDGSLYHGHGSWDILKRKRYTPEQQHCEFCEVH